MSFTFVVGNPTPVPFSVIVDGLDVAGVEADGEGMWPRGITHLYRRSGSVRSVEIDRNDAEYSVRVMTCSSQADYELALAVTERFALALGAPIDPEGAEQAVSFDQFRNLYSSDWVQRMVASGAATVLSIVKDQQSTIQMSGTQRMMAIGPRMVARLEATEPGADMGTKLLTALERLNRVSSDEWFFANSMKITDPSGGEFTVAAFGPGVDYFMPVVERWAFVNQKGGDAILVPVVDIDAVLGHRVEWLDEVNALVLAVTDEEWPAILDRAANVAVD